MPTETERSILTAPGPVARAASYAAREPERYDLVLGGEGLPGEGPVAEPGERQERAGARDGRQVRYPVAALPEQRWILCQPRDVRESYADHVLGRPDEALQQQIWMLRQKEEVRESYIAEVLLAAEG